MSNDEQPSADREALKDFADLLVNLALVTEIFIKFPHPPESLRLEPHLLQGLQTLSARIDEVEAILLKRVEAMHD